MPPLDIRRGFGIMRNAGTNSDEREAQMEAATAEQKTTRPKAIPDFRVFEEREDGLFELLTPDGPIEAPNRKAAVRAIMGSKKGAFLPIREKEYVRVTDEEARSKAANRVQELEARIAELEARA